jgi:hypothetical protein
VVERVYDRVRVTRTRRGIPNKKGLGCLPLCLWIVKLPRNPNPINFPTIRWRFHVFLFANKAQIHRSTLLSSQSTQDGEEGGGPASQRASGSPTTTLSPSVHGSTARMGAASPPLLLRLLTLALALAGAAAGRISGPRTPISRDIYHSRWAAEHLLPFLRSTARKSCPARFPRRIPPPRPGACSVHMPPLLGGRAATARVRLIRFMSRTALRSCVIGLTGIYAVACA